MEKPRKSLSLRLTKREQGQKKLTFAREGEGEVDPAHPAEPASVGGGQEEASNANGASVWLSGLCNLGNTCYANSILQVLRFCPHLSTKMTTLSRLLQQQQQDALQEMPEANGSEAAQTKGCGKDWQLSKGALAIYLHKLWQRMADKERVAANKSSVLSATKPQKFLSKLREEHELFDNKLQHDAQEMLQFLLTSLRETVRLTLESLPSLPLDLALPESLVAGDTREKAIEIKQDGGLTQLSCRKRKHRDEQDKPATTIKRRTASKKLTDFFSSRVASSDDCDSGCGVRRTRRCEEREEVLPNRPRVDLDFVKELFEGELVSQIRCYECDSWTRRTEPFLDISLAVSSHSLPGFPTSSTPVKDNPAAHQGATASGKDSSGGSVVGPFSLSWAISQFCLRETLRGDNKYCCEGCGHLVEAERSVMFGRLPLIVTFHLNRFEMQSLYGGLYTGVSVGKIGGNISTPLSLSLAAWCTEECVRRDVVYQLFAVVFHTGTSCSSGHYTTCVRAWECRDVSSPLAAAGAGGGDGTDCGTDHRNWVEFDDEVVEVLSQQELLDRLSPLTPSTAYILFYTAQ